MRIFSVAPAVCIAAALLCTPPPAAAQTTPLLGELSPDAEGRRAIFTGADTNAELVVRIADREGRVEWTIPPSIRRRDR